MARVSENNAVAQLVLNYMYANRFIQGEVDTVKLCGALKIKKFEVVKALYNLQRDNFVIISKNPSNPNVIIVHTTSNKIKSIMESVFTPLIREIEANKYLESIVEEEEEEGEEGNEDQYLENTGHQTLMSSIIDTISKEVKKHQAPDFSEIIL